MLELIADPLRLSVVRALEERGRASLPELAEAAGVHPNTLRAHVLELESAGLLVSERRVLPSSRGRPGIDYRLSDLWERTSANFLGVAELLAVALERASLHPDQLRAVGSEWGRYLLGRPGSHDIDSELPRVMRELGYEASVEDDQLQLAKCPCPTVAPGTPELMCLLAEGVVEGVLAAAGGDRTASGFHHDRQRRCCGARLAAAK
ncbi:MAG: helix-turn-helix domain-containing protein [Solirubrobacteraceae bacterium]